MSDTRPNDHDHPALTPDLPDHVGNTGDFPARVLNKNTDARQFTRGESHS